MYLFMLDADKARMVIMYRRNGKEESLTPAPFSLRSRFSEYGGKPYWVFGDRLFFVNQADQCLYQQALLTKGVAQPRRITVEPSDSELLMYADVVCVTADILLTIVEQQPIEVDKESENQSFLAAIDLKDPDTAPQVLIRGADFYSNLCLDAATHRLAWVQWDHPNMPWDETELWMAELIVEGRSISLTRARRVELKGSASICQLIFANNGKLFFSADFVGQNDDSSKNFWNVYALDPAEPDTRILRVSEGEREFGYPHWQYGDARIAQYDADTLISFASAADGDVLYKINQDSLTLETFEHRGYGYQNLSATGEGTAVVVVLSKRNSPRLAVLGKDQKQFQTTYAAPVKLSEADISVGEHFKFPTCDGGVAYGIYYAPTNSAYPQDGLAVDAPPLLVMVHGGPTATAYRFFDIQKQFWTQRGFAVFDVNHRGSSGYGRAFRDALYGNWGEIDTSDIVDGINHLAGQSKADADRVVIRGKSAGGYAVLRALTEYPSVFKAGACYYGIGNLVTLAQTTHKFEKYYTDRMIGEAFDADTACQPDSLFYQRSPINNIKQLQSSMIVFQGSQDKVVPPSVAHEIINALKALELEHSYVEYPDEGHGFRHAENNIDAWGRELEFYRSSIFA